MKRLVVEGPKNAYFQDINIPSCPKNGIVAKALFTAISTGTEVRVYRWLPVDPEGEYSHPMLKFTGKPIPNGYCMVAEVIEIGSEVTDYSIGDVVYMGEPHQEYASSVVDNIFKIPEGVSYEVAAFMNVLHVAQGAIRDGNPKPGENVLILGLGVVGLSAVAFSNAFGFNTVAMDLNDKRVEIAREMGAGLSISPSTPGYAEKIKEFFNGQDPDLVIEAASSWRAIKTGLDLVRSAGTVIVVATHTDKPDFDPVGHPYLSKKLTLKTSYGPELEGSRWDKEASREFTFDLLRKNKMDIKPMITDTISWDKIPDIYDRLDKEEQDIAGVLVKWQ